MSLITPQYCQMMARYNTWQNAQMRAACTSLTEEELRADRGAFFGSIMATINHLVWGDTIWMSRFDGGAAPAVPAAEHKEICATFAEWGAAREAMDQRIQAWADSLTSEEIGQDLSWYSGMFQRDYQMPKSVCVVHMFNHQTHHRGQVHAMLTSAGQKTSDTDLIFMPGIETWP
ncbi:DinB family protein [Shimia sp.]|uniref:DinB family protein n=1 Tax=Shimia sp. TaxID=1954381 RepID=UPI003BA92C88